jgi:2-oxoglutarate ferredoxin oxidoreductase subunit beta
MQALPELTQAQKDAIAAYDRNDFASEQAVRWCPGCGDYSVLAQVQRIMPQICAETQTPRERVVFISGIGCASRFPYYMSTYGFHTIHGRAPTIATGLTVTRPDLQVWVITGDGDALSIGGNHFIHALRRNIDIKILMFNNRIYGLTKGQYSPTSEKGKKTKSSPMGTIEEPVNPLYTALACGATFAARAIATEAKHLQDVLLRAAHHRGSAFVEIFQNCNVFNDGAFDSFTEKKVKADRTIKLEHGKPILFGEHNEKTVTIEATPRGLLPKITSIEEVAQPLLFDETGEPNLLARNLALLDEETFPVPIGVFQALRKPVYGDLLEQQIEQAQSRAGRGNFFEHINSGDTWTIAG